jgi:hypothetical protein
MTDKELQSYKTGTRDAILVGTQNENHWNRLENDLYYRSGYDFGLDIRCELEELN